VKPAKIDRPAPVAIRHQDFPGPGRQEPLHGRIHLTGKQLPGGLVIAAFRTAPVIEIGHTANTFKIGHDINPH